MDMKHTSKLWESGFCYVDSGLSCVSGADFADWWVCVLLVLYIHVLQPE
jgi:hypothetical protein